MTCKIEVVELDVNDITENPNNNREITFENREYLDAKLRKYGNLGLLVVDANNMLISGHQRLRLLKEQGVTNVKVARGDFTPEQFDKLAHILNDANYAGDWDAGKLEMFRVAIEELGELDLRTGVDKVFSIDSMDDFSISEDDLKKSAERYEQGLAESEESTISVPFSFATTSENAKKIKSIIAIAKEKYGEDMKSGDALLTEIMTA